MRKIREILRLKYEVGLSNRAIARACSVSNSTTGDYVLRAKRAGLLWPPPDGEAVHRDLARKGVTLKLLWQEYREKYPDRYGYTQFREHNQRWNQSHTTSMSLPHKGGEEMDYVLFSQIVTPPAMGVCFTPKSWSKRTAMQEQDVVDRSKSREVWLDHPEWNKQQLADQVGRSKSWVKKWVRRIRSCPLDDQEVLQGQARAWKHPPRPGQSR